MNQELYEKAKRNILTQKEQEFNEEVKEELKKLVYDSKKLKVTLEKVKEIASLSKKIEAFPCRRMGEDHFLGRKCAQLRNMLETGMYHPKELNELKQFVVERQELERMRNVK